MEFSSASNVVLDKHGYKKRRLLPHTPKLLQQRKLWAQPIFDSARHDGSTDVDQCAVKYQQRDRTTCACGYSGNENILIVGDGDLSFTLALLKHLHSTEHNNAQHAQYCTLCQPSAEPLLVCSTYESYDELCKRYAKACDNIEAIKQYSQVIVLHSVDATNLATTLYTQLIGTDNGLYAHARNTVYNRIVFNFPHTGGKMMLGKNRALIQAFLYTVRENTLNSTQQSAEQHTVRLMCGHHSTVHIALTHGQGGTPSDTELREHGNSWQVTHCAAASGFVLAELYRFNTKLYGTLGYNSKGFRSVDTSFHNHSSLTHVFKMVNDEYTLPYFQRVLDVNAVDIHQPADQYVAVIQQYEQAVQHGSNNSITDDIVPLEIRDMKTSNLTLITASKLVTYIVSLHSAVTELTSLEQCVPLAEVQSLNSLIDTDQLYCIGSDACLLPHILASATTQHHIDNGAPFCTPATPVYNRLRSYDTVSITTPHPLNYTFVVSTKHPVVNYLPEKLWTKQPRYNGNADVLADIQQSTTHNTPATSYAKLQYPRLHQIMFALNDIDDTEFSGSTCGILSVILSIELARISVQPCESVSLSIRHSTVTITQHVVIHHANSLPFPSQHNSVIVGQLGHTSNHMRVCILVLEPLAMLMNNMVDIRQLHTTTLDVLPTPSNTTHTIQLLPSLYSTVYIRDNSLFVNKPTFDERKFISVALMIAGPALIRISLLEVYQHETQGTARTYRFLYQAAPSTAIAHAHIKKIQQILFQTLSRIGLVTLRDADAKNV